MRLELSRPDRRGQGGGAPGDHDLVVHGRHHGRGLGVGDGIWRGRKLGNDEPGAANGTSASTVAGGAGPAVTEPGSPDLAAPAAPATLVGGAGTAASSSHGTSHHYVLPGIFAGVLILAIAWAVVSMPRNGAGVRAGEGP